jgi:TRAP-type C4-dicarboxylate transport system permease small subunit
MEFFRRLDRTWARGEGALTVLVLLSMVFVAGFSAGIRNLTRFDIQWANELLTDMDWADSFLRKATMWLAFLGASQACYYRKHISIDVVVRIAPLKQRYMMHAAAGLIAAAITFAMSYSLAEAVKLNLAERPIEYEMLAESGSQHICDASAEQIKQLEGLSVPRSFCTVRSGLKIFGITAETPGAAFQLIVPFMFFVMGLRFMGAGLGAAAAVASGDEAMRELEAEEHARLQAVHAAVGGGDDSEPPAAGADADEALDPDAAFYAQQEAEQDDELEDGEQYADNAAEHEHAEGDDGEPVDEEEDTNGPKRQS